MRPRSLRGLEMMPTRLNALGIKQKFAVAFGSEDRTLDDIRLGSPALRRALRTRSQAARCKLRDRARCRPCRPVRAPTSNCGFTRMIIRPCVASSGTIAGISRVVEMKLASQTARSNLSRIIRGLKIARVHAFPHHHARIVAQFPIELAVADVDGPDARRAALQQAIRESAGGRADIEADQPVDIDREMIQRGGQLESAAADVGHPLQHFDCGCRRRCCGPGLSLFCPSTRTWPARISACAFSRESASPRSTSELIEAGFCGWLHRGQSCVAPHDAVGQFAQPLARDRRTSAAPDALPAVPAPPSRANARFRRQRET